MDTNIDGRVNFSDFDEDGNPIEKFIQFSVLAMIEVEKHYRCSIEDMPAIIQGLKVRHEDGSLVPAPIRYERDGHGEYVLDGKGEKIELPPEPPRIEEVVTLFRAGMLEYDDTVSFNDVAKMMTRIGVTKAGTLLEEAVIAAFPDANAEAAGNRQQRRAAKAGNRKGAEKKKGK